MKRKLLIASLIASPFLILGLIVWNGYRMASATIKRHRIQVDKDLAELQKRDGRRSAYLQPEIEGNAWDHYRQAIDGVTALGPSGLDVFPSFSGEEDPPLDASKMEPILEKLRPAFEEIARGVSSTFVHSGRNYAELDAHWNLNTSGLMKLSKALNDCANLRLLQNRDAEAIDCIILGVGMGSDLAELGSLMDVSFSLNLKGNSLYRLRTLLKKCPRIGESYSRLGRTLDLALLRDQIFEGVKTDIAVAKACYFEIGLDEYREVHKGAKVLKKRWYHLFSDHFLLADLLNELDEVAKVVDQWPGLSVAQKRHLTNPEFTMDDIQSSLLYFKYLQQSQHDELQMRLARLATAVAWYQTDHGDFPKALADLTPKYIDRLGQDPYTDLPWNYVVTPTEAKVYSFGGDLDDDGGRALEEGYYDTDGDVVWIVGRNK